MPFCEAAATDKGALIICSDKAGTATRNSMTQTKKAVIRFFATAYLPRILTPPLLFPITSLYNIIRIISWDFTHVHALNGTKKRREITA
jgi:magnesium-transporting ATPase (P-type)